MDVEFKDQNGERGSVGLLKVLCFGASFHKKGKFLLITLANSYLFLFFPRGRLGGKMD